MDSYQKAFYAAASLADVHKFNVRTGARTLALSASLADVEKAKAELQRQQHAAKEKISAVISDCYHQNEVVISTTRLHLLTQKRHRDVEIVGCLLLAELMRHFLEAPCRHHHSPCQ